VFAVKGYFEILLTTYWHGIKYTGENPGRRPGLYTPIAGAMGLGFYKYKGKARMKERPYYIPNSA
jgi:hypothetical protein